MAGLLQRIAGTFAKGRQLLAGEQAGPIASFVRNPYGGHPAAGLSPERLALILRSSITGFPERYLELAEDMEERFPQYGSVLATRKRQVARLEFSVVPAGEDEADKQEAALVERVINSAPFRVSKIDQLDAIGKSFSCVEMIWGEEDGTWLPQRFAYRDPRFFRFDDVDPEHMRLVKEGGFEELIPYKWLVHKARAKSGLTIRGGLARQVAWLYLFHAFNLKDWAIFAEAFGQPFKIGKYDPSATDKDKQALLEGLRNMGVDFSAIIPVASQIEFLKTDITGSTDLYEKRADFLDRQVSKIVLGQTGTTDGIEGGGYALGKVHNEVREDIQDSDGEQWAATLNEQLVPPLIGFNFGARARKGLPEIVIGRPEEEDVKAWTENVARLVPMGLKVSMAEAQAKIGVTPPKDDEEILVSSAPAIADPDEEEDAAPPPAPRRTAASLNIDPGLEAAEREREAIDALTQDTAILAAPAIEQVLELIAAIVARASSLEDVRAQLLALKPDIPTKALAMALRQARIVARLSGRGELADGL